MKTKSQLWRLLAVLFVAALLLLAAMAPAAVALPFVVLIFGLWSFVPFVIAVPLPRVDERSREQQSCTLLAFSPRPPPAL